MLVDSNPHYKVSPLSGQFSVDLTFQCRSMQVRRGLLQLVQGRREAALLRVPQELPGALQRLGAQGLRKVRPGIPARHGARLHGHRRVRRQQGGVIIEFCGIVGWFI